MIVSYNDISDRELPKVRVYNKSVDFVAVVRLYGGETEVGVRAHSILEARDRVWKKLRGKVPHNGFVLRRDLGG